LGAPNLRGRGESVSGLFFPGAIPVRSVFVPRQRAGPNPGDLGKNPRGAEVGKHLKRGFIFRGGEPAPLLGASAPENFTIGGGPGGGGGGGGRGDAGGVSNLGFRYGGGKTWSRGTSAQNPRKAGPCTFYAGKNKFFFAWHAGRGGLWISGLNFGFSQQEQFGPTIRGGPVRKNPPGTKPRGCGGGGAAGGNKKNPRPRFCWAPKKGVFGAFSKKLVLRAGGQQKKRFWPDSFHSLREGGGPRDVRGGGLGLHLKLPAGGGGPQPKFFWPGFLPNFPPQWTQEKQKNCFGFVVGSKFVFHFSLFFLPFFFLPVFRLVVV